MATTKRRQTPYMLSPAKRRRKAKLPLGDLPEELLVEILIRLPLRYAIQCKSVCKIWYSLISKSEFRCRFICFRSSIKQNQPVALIGSSSDRNPFKPYLGPQLISFTDSIFQCCGYSFKFLPSFSKFRVVQTFNDLVLCYDADEDLRAYYVCNPLTMQWMALPLAPVPHQSSFYVCFMCEPCYNEDPTDGTIKLNTHHRFKVLCFLRETNHDIYLETFSSEVGHWNETVLSLPDDMAMDFLYMAAAGDDGKKLVLMGHNEIQNQLVTVIVESQNLDKYRRVVSPAIKHPDMNIARSCYRNFRMAFFGGRLNSNIQIWELSEYREWKLVQSTSKWRTVTLDELRIPKDGLISYDWDVLHSICYNLTFGLYDLRQRKFHLASNDLWVNFTCIYPLVLPFWPTPIPQI